MKTQYITRDFEYDLPEKLIAKYPLTTRSESRLLVLDEQRDELKHCQFTQLVDFLRPGDLLVFNDTKVIPARLFGVKKTGGKIECLVERILSEKTALVHLRASKSPKSGQVIIFSENTVAKVLTREQDLFILEFEINQPLLSVLEKIGEIPIPPYLDREVVALDSSRYQTVFASKAGAVAAPTAALHFDKEMFHKLAEKKISETKVTLHVGAGTFLPMRTENLNEHVMHKESLEVSAEVCEKINHTKAMGGRVIAVGTTVVRSLETAGQEGGLKAFQGDTQLFITPGYQFKVVDKLLTNFHLPRSTLLMLVCALGGYERVMQAYRVAIESEYRFFSYGDAMLL